jgi:hypothetical protein
MLEPLATISVVALVIAFGCAAWIAWDILVRGHRLRMGVMEVVWPVTALYLGPLAVWWYGRWRTLRDPSPSRGDGSGGDPSGGRAGNASSHEPQTERPMPVATTLAVTHCGAGCTLGDIIGSTLVFVAAVQVAGLALWPELAVDFVLAFSLGIVFQFLTIAPMRGLGLRAGIVAALKADTLSLISFEVGLFAWMIVVQLVLFPEHLHPNEPTFWFMMQIGMVLGFLTAWPVDWWLVGTGLKERM